MKRYHDQCEILHSCSFRGPGKRANDDGHYSGLDFRRTYQTVVSGNFENVDSVVFGNVNLRPPVSLGVDGLSQELSESFESNLEIVRCIYMFLTIHIRYDCKEPDKENALIIRDGVANAFGICMLFFELCERNNIRSGIIRGYIKTLENPEVLGDCNFCWNKVKIRGEWHLVDCCWGGDFFFLTNPKKFVMTHLPFHEGDQFVYPPLTKHDFRTLVFCYRSRLFDFGIVPDNAVSYRYFTKLKTNYVTLRFRYSKKRGKGNQSLPFTPVGNSPHTDGTESMTPSSPSSPSSISHPFDMKNVSNVISSSYSSRLRKLVRIEFTSPENGKPFILSGKYNNFFIVHDFSSGFLIHLFLPYRGCYRVNLHFSPSSTALNELFQFCCSYCFSVEKQFMYDISFFRQQVRNPVNNLMILSPVQNILQYERSVKVNMFVRQEQSKKPFIKGLRIRIASMIRPTSKMILNADLRRKFLQSLGDEYLLENENEKKAKKNSHSSKKEKGKRKGKKKNNKGMEVSNPTSHNRNITMIDLKNDWTKGRRNVITKKVLLQYYPEDDLNSIIDSLDESALQQEKEKEKEENTSKLLVVGGSSDGDMFRKSKSMESVSSSTDEKNNNNNSEEEFYHLRALIEYQLVGSFSWEIAAEYYLTEDSYNMVDFDIQGKTFDGFDQLEETKIYESLLNYETNKYFDSFSRIMSIGTVLRTGGGMGMTLAHPDRSYLKVGTLQTIPILMKFISGEVVDHFDFFLSYRRFFRFETSFNIFYVNERNSDVSSRILFTHPGKYVVEIGYREKNRRQYKFAAKFVVEVLEHDSSNNHKKKDGSSSSSSRRRGSSDNRSRRKPGQKMKLPVPILQRCFNDDVSTHSLMVYKPLFDTEIMFRQLYNFLYSSEDGKGESGRNTPLSQDMVGKNQKTIVFSKKEPEVELSNGMKVVLSQDVKDDEKRIIMMGEIEEGEEEGSFEAFERKRRDPEKEKKRVMSGMKRFSFIPKPDDYGDVIMFDIMKKAKVKIFEHRKKIIRTLEPKMKMKFQVGKYKKYGIKFKLSNFMEELGLGKTYFLDVGSRGEYNIFFNFPRRDLYMLQIMVKEYIDGTSYFLREGTTYWIRVI